MSFEEFLVLISRPNPTQDDIAQAAMFMEGLSPVDLNALALRAGVHAVFRRMLRDIAARRTATENIEDQVDEVAKRSRVAAGPSM